MTDLPLERDGQKVEYPDTLEVIHRPDAAEPQPRSQPPPRSRRPRLHWRIRHYLRELDHTGVILGLLTFAMSLTPSLLPRPWPMQGLVSGVTVAGGYGAGVALSWLARAVGVPSLNARLNSVAWRVVWVVSSIGLPLMLWQYARWQAQIRRAVGEPPAEQALFFSMFVLAMVLAVVLIGIARGLHDLYQLLADRLLRVLPRRTAKLLASLLVVLLFGAVVDGVVYRGFVKFTDHIFSEADRDTRAGVHQPGSALRSGSSASLVPWATLGEYGRTFVASGPTPGQIQTQTGRPAQIPIRVFAGLESAGDLTQEAQLVLAELKRTGAFDRSVLALATTTGKGWVDPDLANPLEFVTGGDSAIAAIQYSYLPSWVSFVTDRDRAGEAGVALFRTVHDYWATLPADDRPKLVVFGESLGAFGAGTALRDVQDLIDQTDGALFAGPPNITQPWRDLTGQRKAGSPERLPIYGNGNQVRFVASAADLAGLTGRPDVIYLQHASDPVVWWSPKLIWHQPDWLKEPHGPDVVGGVRWYPFVTFWQVTSDLTVALDPPPGHGHNYGPEVTAAWTALLSRAG